ncbi:MAG: hypothetical protein ACFFDT_20635, partial [Candidatus Hodarchaeota archaeon]
CVSPVMGSKISNIQESRVYIPSETIAIQDSGAFCDGIDNRVSYKEALNRQRKHAKKYKYEENISHIASYDLLIDEKWNSKGERRKERWDESEAWYAVWETINAAKFLHKNRDGKNLILSAQGITLKQYMNCAEEIVPLMRSNDIFGLGGWCVLGQKKNNLRDSFRRIMIELIPFLGENNIKNIHIWGVIYPFPLGELLYLCDMFNIKLSTDSSGPQKRPIFGTWGYGDWKDKKYVRPNVQNRGQERAKHVMEVRKWLENFRETKYYRFPSDNYIWKEN